MGTKFGTAICGGEDSFRVGQQVATQAIQKAGCSNVDFTIIFSSGNYDYKLLLDGVKSIVGESLVVGCTSAGVFNEEKIEVGSVACGVISSDTHKFYGTYGSGLKKNEALCFKEAIAKLPRTTEGFPYRSLIMFIDGLSGKGEESSLLPLMQLGPNIKVSGGAAGDDCQFKSTKVFKDDMIGEDAISLSLVNSKLPVSIGVKHGHYPISRLLTVTKAEESKVYELDNSPAVTVWIECIRESAKKIGIDVDKMWEVQEQLVKCSGIFSIGLFTGDGYKVRSMKPPQTKDYLQFSCAIPKGCVVKVMESTKENQIYSAREAALNALKSVGGMKLAGAMVFDCVVRGLILGDDFCEAIKEIKNVLGDIPLLGFKTYGEFASELGQLSGFHNTTTVVLLFPE